VTDSATTTGASQYQPASQAEKDRPMHDFFLLGGEFITVIGRRIGRIEKIVKIGEVQSNYPASLP
jgi:hypothetical protein